MRDEMEEELQRIGQDIEASRTKIQKLSQQDPIAYDELAALEEELKRL